jgi:hypothetical protein
VSIKSICSSDALWDWSNNDYLTCHSLSYRNAIDWLWHSLSFICY